MVEIPTAEAISSKRSAAEKSPTNAFAFAERARNLRSSVPCWGQQSAALGGEKRTFRDEERSPWDRNGSDPQEPEDGHPKRSCSAPRLPFQPTQSYSPPLRHPGQLDHNAVALGDAVLSKDDGGTVREVRQLAI